MNRLMVEVDTSEYVKAHGKEPRGLGTWAFSKVSPSRADYTLDHLIWRSGLYSTCRTSAILEAKKENIERLYVCS